jgi:hypothetical protein
LNCYFHPETISVIQCKGCNKYLCDDCHDIDYSEFCFVCSLNARNNEVEQSSTNEMSANLISIIGWYEIIGGAIGGLLILFFGPRIASASNVSYSLIFILFFFLFMFSIFAGVILLQNRTKSFEISIFVQALQVFQFIVKGTYFSFIAGAQLTFQFFEGTSTNFRLNFGIISEFNFLFHIQNTSSIFSMLSINIVPIVIIYILFKGRVMK